MRSIKRLSSLLFFIVLFLWPQFNQGQTIKKHILFINSYHQQMLWVRNILQAVEDVIEPDKNQTIIHVENLDTKYFNEKNYLKKFQEMLRIKYQGIKLELIFSSDNNAFDFLRRFRDNLFPGVPVVFCGVNDFEKDSLRGLEKFTGVAETISDIQTIELMLRLHPGTKEIFVINDQLVTGQAWTRSIKKNLRRFNFPVQFRFSGNQSIEELQREISHLKPGTLVLLGVFYADRNNHFYSYEKSAELLAKDSPVPFYCLVNFSIQKGVVGGKVLSGYYHGLAMAQIGKRILAGEDGNKIPVSYDSNNQFIFNYPELERHQIAFSRLPRNSIFIHESFNFYQKYKGRIWAFGSLIVVLILVIFFLIQNIIRRKQGEAQIKSLNKELSRLLEEKSRKLDESLEYLQFAQKQLMDSEKLANLGTNVAEVAHEINNPLGIGITGMSHLNHLTRNILTLYQDKQLGQDQFQKYLESMSELGEAVNRNLYRAAELVKSFKRIAADQAHEELQPFQVKSYMEELLLSLDKKFKYQNIRVTVVCDEALKILSYPGLFAQIITNLVLNALTHAFNIERQDKEIKIEIDKRNDRLYLVIQDNGVGIVPENLPKIFKPFFTTKKEEGGTGLGLSIVHNLVSERLNGQIKCDSRPGVGTIFYIDFPLEK